MRMPGRSSCRVLAAAVGHPDVGDQEVEGTLAQRGERLRAVLRGHYLVSVAGEHDREELAHRTLVVHQQDACGRVSHGPAV
jgi:hypothetical protein